jgi:hypothetical protein
VDTWSPDGQNRGYHCTFQCQKTGKVMTEEDTPKNSCWKFARRKNFPSNDEQIKNLWRNRLGRRVEKMSFVSLVALSLSIVSLTFSLFPQLTQLIKQWLGIG